MAVAAAMVLLEPLVAGGVVLQEFSVETATALPELSATMAVTPSSTSVVVESLGSSQRCGERVRGKTIVVVSNLGCDGGISRVGGRRLHETYLLLTRLYPPRFHAHIKFGT